MVIISPLAHLHQIAYPIIAPSCIFSLSHLPHIHISLASSSLRLVSLPHFPLAPIRTSFTPLHISLILTPYFRGPPDAAQPLPPANSRDPATRPIIFPFPIFPSPRTPLSDQLPSAYHPSSTLILALTHQLASICHNDTSSRCRPIHSVARSTARCCQGLWLLGGAGGVGVGRVGVVLASGVTGVVQILQCHRR